MATGTTSTSSSGTTQVLVHYRWPLVIAATPQHLLPLLILMLLLLLWTLNMWTFWHLNIWSSEHLETLNIWIYELIYVCSCIFWHCWLLLFPNLHALPVYYIQIWKLSCEHNFETMCKVCYRSFKYMNCLWHNMYTDVIQCNAIQWTVPLQGVMPLCGTHEWLSYRVGV